MKLYSALVCVVVALFAPLAQAQYLTQFEPPAFSSGQILNQDSWTTTANFATARVLSQAELDAELTNAGLTPGQTVHSGSQALFVSGSGASNSTIRVISGLDSQPLIRLDVWTRPMVAGTTGAPLGNIFLTLEDAGGVRAAAFRYGTAFGQSIDYGTNVTGIWQSSNILWDTNQWYHFTLDVDYTAKTYQFAVNGTQVSASPIPFYSAASVSFSQIRIFRGQNQAGMIVDDLSVSAVPEPASVWLMLASMLAFCARTVGRGRTGVPG